MKVAIVCGSPSSEMLAPFEDKSWEIWVLGNRIDHYKGKRVTRIFEVHNNLSEHPNITKYVDYLSNQDAPIVTGETWPKPTQNAVPYPYRAVQELYGSLYLTSSPAYMIAYALLDGATEIGLYGVDLSVSDHEYFWQRPCVEAWIGFAKGRGVKVTIPEVSHVGKSSYVEGRDWNGDTEVGLFSEEDFSAQATECATKREELQRQRQALALKAASLDGAEQVYKHLAKVARANEAKVDIKSLKEATVLR